MSAEEAEAQRRWPMPHPAPRNVNERRSNLVSSALRQGFVEGVAWERARLAAEAAAAAPDPDRCSECGEPIEGASFGSLRSGYGMCASCLHDAVRSGWGPGG